MHDPDTNPLNLLMELGDLCFLCDHFSEETAHFFLRLVISLVS
jgi:hypothetical protein